MPKHSPKNYYKCCLPEKPFRGSSTVWFILLFMKSTKIPTGGKLCLPCPIFAVPQLRSHGLQVLFLTPRFKTHTTEGKYSRQEKHRDINLLPLIMFDLHKTGSHLRKKQRGKVEQTTAATKVWLPTSPTRNLLQDWKSNYWGDLSVETLSRNVAFWGVRGSSVQSRQQPTLTERNHRSC